MKSLTLPGLMARFFSVLFYGQLVVLAVVTGLLLFLVISPSGNESGTFQFPVQLNGRFNIAQETDKAALANWLEAPQSFELKVGTPAFLSRGKPSEDTYWLSLSVRSWADLMELPWLLGSMLGGGLLLILLLLWITYQFKQIFWDITRQRVFEQQQSQRLVRIGVGFLVYAFVGVCLQVMIQQGAVSLLESNGYVLRPSFRFSVGTNASIEWSWFVAGFCILALAQVFKYGRQLQQESELTI